LKQEIQSPFSLLQRLRRMAWSVVWTIQDGLGIVHLFRLPGGRGPRNPQAFPDGRLTVVGASRFETDHVAGVTLEDSLLGGAPY
jgi:hypothetical protein